MEKFDIESIKDAVYELEGLLELAELREDKLEAFLPLMRNKLKIINTLFDDSESAEDEEDEVYEDDSLETDEIFSAEEEKEDKSVTEEEVAVSEEISEPVDITLPEEMVSAESVSLSEPMEAVKEPAAARPAFCINDRFRFRRELFNNSDADFNATMDLVATMEDYDEAEAYFIGEREWDPEKEEVMDFMAIIRSYFEKD